MSQEEKCIPQLEKSRGWSAGTFYCATSVAPFVSVIKNTTSVNQNGTKYGKPIVAEVWKLHPNIPGLPSGHDVLALCVLHAACLYRHLLMYTGALKRSDTPLLELSDGEGKLIPRQLQTPGNVTNSS